MPAKKLSEKALGLARGMKLQTHHRAVRKHVRMVLVDEFLHSHLPQFEHLGAPVGEQGQLLQHHIPWDTDLLPQVQA